MQIADILTSIIPQFEATIREWATTVGTAGTLANIEEALHQRLMHVGQQCLQALVTARGAGLCGPERPCSCGAMQTYHRQDHPLTVQSSFGLITWRTRARYRCARCGRRDYPNDDARALAEQGRMSPYLQERVAWLAAQLPYAQACATLTRFHWADVALSSGWRASQRVAVQVEQAEEHRQQQREAGTVPPACAATSERIYVGMDGFAFCTRERDTHGYQWRQMKTAVTYDVAPSTDPPTALRATIAASAHVACPPEDHAQSCQYIASTHSWATFGRAVWGAAWERGLDGGHHTLVVVADGAPALDQIVDMELRLPGVAVTRILDLRHAQQPLWQVAHAAFADDAPAWMQEVGWALEQGQLDEVLQSLHTVALLEALDRPTVAHLAATAYRYFDQRAWQTDYPTFIARGLQIGSGLAESTCKRFGMDRMKGTGMRWSLPGAHHLATLRALLLSQRWQEISTPAA